MEAEEELAKETVRAFKAGLHGEEYDNPFTEAEDAAKRENGDPAEVDSHPRESNPPPA